jgi:hypothetical protein
MTATIARLHACPSWCEVEHEPGEEFVVHKLVLATWESTDRTVSVGIEALGPTGDAAICVTFDDACEAWDDLTAEQARELGPFLLDALNLAATQVEEVRS